MDELTRKVDALSQSLRTAWSLETASPWRPDNPAAGQCSVTALVVHEALGGEILKTEVNGAWHFYNQIEGRRIDLTASQFGSAIRYEDVPSNRADALMDTTDGQYRVLRARVIS